MHVNNLTVAQTQVPDVVYSTSDARPQCETPAHIQAQMTAHKLRPYQTDSNSSLQAQTLGILKSETLTKITH